MRWKQCQFSSSVLLRTSECNGLSKKTKNGQGQVKVEADEGKFSPAYNTKHKSIVPPDDGFMILKET